MSLSRKKIMIIGAIVVLLIICLIVFFSARSGGNVAIISPDDPDVENLASGDTADDASSAAQAEEDLLPIPKKEFTEFGDFWIEIERDGLKIKAPVLDGVEKESLKRGVGHHKTSADPNPNSGNIVLSGHRWLPGSNPANTVFRHLDKLQVGDTVKLVKGGKEYTYKVRESRTVSDDALEILDDTENPQLTLYTCTPLFTALRRLVYVADFVSVKDAS